jgi:hypothetical protein
MAGGRSDWRVRGPFGDVEIELRPASRVDGAVQEASVRELSRMVHDFTHRESEARRVLLDVYARLQGLGSGAFRGHAFELDSGSTRAATIGAELIHAARAGNLVLRRVERRIVTIPIDVESDAEEALGPDSSSPTQTTWIAIELIDEAGQPIPGVAYQVTLPDGSTQEGTLDSAGKAMIRGIDPPGQCGVTFPQLDQQTWGPA